MAYVMDSLLPVATIGSRGGEATKGHLLKRREHGFTLVELLIVIGIIAILAALLLPALSRARVRAQSITCQSNEKQLQLCSHLYSADNHGLFIPNNSVATISPGTNNNSGAFRSGISWCLDSYAPTQLTPDTIEQGCLWDYNRSLGIYHCPSDRSVVLGTNQLRWRSYNLSQSINGAFELSPYPDAQPGWKSDQQVTDTALIFTFIDEHPGTMCDAQFGCPVPGSWFDGYWWDMPSDRHNQGASLAFVDGHVERWKWAAPKLATLWVQPVSQSEMPDYRRLQASMKR